jgi:branched-chain amino acid transport system ATP-binding protein
MPHLSALENVLVGQHCRNNGFFGVLQPVNLMPGNRWRQEARTELEEAGLGAYERATVGSLPYGLQKRIELVRALMAKPRLLLLDEPAAGLNPAETDALRERITTICRDRGITLLVVEHDMHFVGALCAEVVVPISAGRLPRAHPSTCAKTPWSGRPIRHQRRGAASCVLTYAIFTFATGACTRCAVSLTVEAGEIVAVLGANARASHRCSRR